MPEHQQTQQSKNPKLPSSKRIFPSNQNHVLNIDSIIQRARTNPKSLTAADVLQLQSTIGNRAVGRLLSEIRNTSKVQEAPIQRQEMMEEEPLQTKRENNTGMPDNLKAGVESLSGIDISEVRVHYNSDKPTEVGALAYTQGTDIHVASRQEKHLPHETWHVVQQAQGRVQPTMQIKDEVQINDDRVLEHEADVMGSKAMQMNGGIRSIRTTGAIRAASFPAQTPCIIQRQALRINDILEILDKIVDHIGKGRFRKELKKDFREKQVRAHIEKVMDNYQKHLKYDDTIYDNAMMLAIAIQNVARVIAKELFDPWLESELAMKLFELYRGEIAANLQRKGVSKEEGNEILNLSHALTLDDPVSKYMHGEIRKDLAIEQIRDMAKKVEVPPVEMFRALSERFQAEMGTYTKKEIEDMQDNRPIFNVREAPGHLSIRYYQFLLGENVDVPSWEPETLMGNLFDLSLGPDREVLKLTEKAKNMLDALEYELKNPSATPEDVGLRDPTMTKKQERHLREIEQEEQKQEIGNIKSDLVRILRSNFAYTSSEAIEAIEQVGNWLHDAPLTITVQSSDWFGKTPSRFLQKRKLPHTKFMPATDRTREKKISELFGKGKGKIKYYGKYEHPKYNIPSDPDKRGDEYMVFRTWKDNLMTSLLGFSPGELPIFGAMNVNWKKNRGSTKGTGINYYGDVHFLLKRENVEDRLVYTATDHGAPRRDPLLALHDFAFQGMGLTQMKDRTKTHVIGEVVNAAKKGSTSFINDLPFEIQIFGTVDVAVDVEKIFLAPSVGDLVKENVIAFSKKTGVLYQIIEKPDEAFEVISNPKTVKVALLEETLKPEQRPNLNSNGFIRSFQVIAYRIANLDPDKIEDAEIIIKLEDELNSTFNQIKDDATPEIKNMNETAKKVLQSAMETLILEQPVGWA